MGLTPQSKEEVEKTITRLIELWPGDDYSLIHHNCLHFCNALCAELGVGKIPGWVNRFGRTAATIDKTRHSIKQTTEATKEVANHLYRQASDLVTTADAGQP